MAVDQKDLERLRSQLETERNELRRQRSEADASVKKMQQEMQQVRQSLITSTKNMQGEMTRKFQNMEESVRKSYAQEISQMKQSYEQICQHVQQLEEEYRSKLAQLAREEQEVLDKLREKERHLHGLMKKNEEKMREAVSHAYQYPIEVFYPHRLQHYIEAGEEAARLAEHGLFSEAASLYDTAAMRVTDLTEDTQIKVHELDMMFEIYRTVLANAESLCQSPWELKNDAGEVTLSLTEDVDRDYWSDMLYDTLMQELEKHRRIAEAGSEEWVKMQGNSGISPALLLDKQIRQLETIPRQLEICIRYALSACDCYNYFFDLRDMIFPIMSDQNYIYDRILFGKRSPANADTHGYEHYRQWLAEEECLEAGAEPDYREERCMQFFNSEGNQCRIFMIPVRKDNGTVAFRLFLDSQAECQPLQVQQALQNVLQNGLPQIQVEIAQNPEQMHTQQNRPMTKEIADVLAGNPDQNHLEARYCMGI